MKIAIHHKEDSFSDRWIEYCRANNIDYKIVNAYDNDIIEQLKGWDVLMWHHNHAIHKDVLAAKPILFALEHAGFKVFPNFKTAWHFDDKVAQKYLLEAIEAPLVPSYVFYDKQTALEWVKNTSFPKVFKLKGGAGATNVKLVLDKKYCVKLIHKAFGKGFSQYDRLGGFKERIRKVKEGKDSWLGVLKGLGRLITPTEFARQKQREKGYIYFQEFIPGNESDTRVIVINGKAYAVKRFVRKGDFRASGSGNIDYSVEKVDKKCIELAFSISEKLKSQCIAFDFVFDSFNNPLLIEISYGFAVSAYDNCEGYWTEDLRFHQGSFNPQEWMVESILNENTIR